MHRGVSDLTTLAQKKFGLFMVPVTMMLRLRNSQMQIAPALQHYPAISLQLYTMTVLLLLLTEQLNMPCGLTRLMMTLGTMKPARAMIRGAPMM
jgi:hypothetical protein